MKREKRKEKGKKRQETKGKYATEEMDGDKQNGMKNNQINNNREGYEIKK